MFARLSHSLLVVASYFLLQSHAAAAQTPDTTRAVFSESLRRGSPAYVVLAEGTVYRVEVIPRGAAVTIRSATRLNHTPIALRALSDAAVAEGGTSYSVVPTLSDEYRVDVLDDLGQDVRVRIFRDERETRLLAGHGRVPGFLTLGLRAVVLAGSFETVRPGSWGTPDSTLQGGAIGAELCLGLERGAMADLPRLGGCLATFGSFAHSGGANLTTIGTAPHWLVSAPDRPLEIAIALQFAVGQAEAPFRRDVTYRYLGAGPEFSWRVTERATFTLSPAVSLVVRGGHDALNPTTGLQRPIPSRTSLVARIGGAVHLRL